MKYQKKFLLRVSLASLALSPLLMKTARGQDDAFEDLDLPADEKDSGESFETFDTKGKSEPKSGDKAKPSAKSDAPPTAGSEAIAEGDAFPEDELDTQSKEFGSSDLDKELDANTDGNLENDEGFVDSDKTKAPGDTPGQTAKEAGKPADKETPPAANEPPVDSGAADLLSKDEPVEGFDSTLSETEGQQGAPAPKDGVPGSLLESSADTFDPNDPSYSFARVPLLPPMSDENWKKWAGTGMDKMYRVRKKDTLWGVSERLFGNPFLWPKVWQLNANFGNPHKIEPKIDLQFTPGNPNSSPIVAVMSSEGEMQNIPFTVTTQRLSTLEHIEAVLNFKLRSSEPPFKNFLAEVEPKPAGKIPGQENAERTFYLTGDKFPITNVADGNYNIIRSNPPIGIGGEQTTHGAIRLLWVGRIEIADGHAKISEAYDTIEKGDLIVDETFEIPALSLQEVAIGGEKNMEFIPLQEGAYLSVSQFKVFGLRLPETAVAPPGSLLTFEQRGLPIGSGLVVHRSGRFATVWVTESSKEIDSTLQLR